MRATLLAIVLFTTGLGLAPAALAQKARITMVSSSTRVAVGEPFALEIRADVSGDDVDDITLPDFGKLEVLGQHTSRPMSFSFGFGSDGRHARMQSQIIHGFTLRALEPGTYTIQPAILRVAGRKYASSGVTIQATGAPLPGSPLPPGQQPDGQLDPNSADSITPPEGALSGATFDRDLFLRTVVDKPRAYVGEQVTVTVYLYVRGALTQNPSITREPTMEGFWVQDLLPLQRSLSPVRQEINGRTFNVYLLRRYAAFALRDGKLQVGAPAVEIAGGSSIFDLLTGPTATVRRTGVVAPIEALRLPARSSTAPSHVGQLTLEASVNPSSAKVGDAITLRVTAKGTGNLKALKLPTPRLPGVEVLAPEIDDKPTNDLDLVGGERTFRWLLLPRAPGTPTVPAFVVDSFDPLSKMFTTVSSKPLTLSLSGVAAPAAPTGSASPAGTQAPEKTSEPPKSFGPARLSSSLRRAAPPISHAAWFPWAVLMGPLLVLGALLARLGAKRLAESRVARPADVALRGAEQKLHEAGQAAKAGDATRAYGSLLSALRSALQARLDEPVGGLTLPMLRRRCEARGIAPDLTERVMGELTSCEQARFNPSLQAAEPLDRHVAEVKALLQQLSRITPRMAA